MRIRSLILPTFVCLGCLSSCADHDAFVPAGESKNPPPPVSGPDIRVADPEEVPTPPVRQPGGGNGGGGGGGGGSSAGGSGGGAGGGGGGGGAPVPEPATMLLVGTGLAGAALYRRRRKLTDQ